MTTERSQLKLSPIPPNKLHQKHHSCSQSNLHMHSQHQLPDFDENSHLLSPCHPRGCFKKCQGSKIYKNYPKPCSCLGWKNLRDRSISRILSEENMRRYFKKSQILVGQNSSLGPSRVPTADSLAGSLENSPVKRFLFTPSSIQSQTRISKRDLRVFSRFFDYHPYFPSDPSLMASNLGKLKSLKSSFVNEISKALSLPQQKFMRSGHKFDEKRKLPKERDPEKIREQFKIRRYVQKRRIEEEGEPLTHLANEERRIEEEGEPLTHLANEERRIEEEGEPLTHLANEKRQIEEEGEPLTHLANEKRRIEEEGLTEIERKEICELVMAIPKCGFDVIQKKLPSLE